MNSLSHSADNSKLSCQCGAHSVTAAAWNAMTEHQQLKFRQQAQACSTCAQDKWRQPRKEF